MGQCRGRTKSGDRCKKVASKDGHYCAIHRGENEKSIMWPTIAGTILGNVIAPGLGGIIVGGATGAYVGEKIKENSMSNPKVFISFDYDHDETLKTFLIGQSKLADSPFEISDWSIKEHITGDWKAKATTRIKRSDIVVVICGTHTNTAAGVSAELSIAQEVGKPYFLLKGYKDKVCIKPKSAKSSDSIYKWTWPNLKLLIGGSR